MLIRPEYTYPVSNDTLVERSRQDDRFGVQSHPDGTGARIWDVLATMRKALNDAAVAGGTLTWLDILIEEVDEAFAETDTARLRTELIQVAAVAQAWVEDIDSRDQGV